MTLKRLNTLLLALLCSLVSFAEAQTYMYRGRSDYSGDILYSFDGLIPLPILLMMMH